MSLLNIALVANILLVAVTAYYAILTQMLLRATKRQMDLAEKQLDSQQRPYIEISAGTREGASLFQLRIVNTGANTARNVRFTLAPEFYRYHEKTDKNHMQNMHPFSQVIPSFPAKQELVFDLGVTYKFFQGDKNDEITPPSFSVGAVYWWGSKKYEEETLIDLRMFYGVSAASAGSLQEFKEINKNLQQLTNAVKAANEP